MRTLILFWLLLLFTGFAYGQSKFTGLYNGGGILINQNDTLFVGGTLVNNNANDFNINNSGTIIITDSLINRTGKLFALSSAAVNPITNEVTSKGEVIFNSTEPQYIQSADNGYILFNDLSIRDTITLLSDIHVTGSLKLDKWSEPSRLLLGGKELRMYDAENANDALIKGLIEGEDETHYITGNGSIRTLKRYAQHPALGLDAMQSMGLHLSPVGNSGYVLARRFHKVEPNAAWGSIRKYYELETTGSGFGNIGIRYFNHDLTPENYDQTALQLFYSTDGTGAAYRIIDSEPKPGMMVGSTGMVETAAFPATFRYTAASRCNLPGITLGEDYEACINATITITPAWKGGQPSGDYYYEWNNDPQTIEYKTQAVPKTFTLHADTLITVSVVDTKGCKGTDTLRITARPAPVARISEIATENTMQCITHTWAFQADTVQNQTTYTWHFGDATTQNGTSVSKDYSLPGTYHVRLTADNQYGCSTTDSVRIVVEGMPEPDFLTQTLSEKKIRLIDQSLFHSNEKNYTWLIMQNTYNTATVDIDFPDFGQYPVELTVSGNKCSASIVRDISVTEKGSLGFRIENTALCQGAALQFTNESVCLWGKMNFEWDFGDGTRSTETNPAKTYHDTKTTGYTVTLRAIDPETGWSAVLTRDITVHQPPQINWGGTIATCDNQWILRPEEPAYTYLWSNGSTADALTVTQSGQYSLRLTDINGCRSIESVHITLNTAVIPTISDSQSCGSLLLDAGNPGSTYLWNNGATTRTILAAQSGTYQVSVTQYNGCTGSKTVQVAIQPSPLAKVQGPVTLCEGETANLYTLQQPGIAYRWSTGAATSGITISGEGWYHVTATDPQTSCTSADSVYITAQAAPVIDLGTDRNICIGQETVLKMDDYHYATEVVWWDKHNQMTYSRSYTVSDTGTYYLRVTLANGCSAVSQVRYAGIATPLNLDFLAASQSFIGDTLMFIDLSYPDPIAWNWEINTGFRTNEPVFQYAFWNEGIYQVKLSVDNGGCVLSGSKTVTVYSRLKGKDDEDKAPEGEEVPEEIPGEGLFRPAADIMQIAVAPNPSDGSFRIEAQLAQPSTMIARLYNVTGQAVASFVIPKQTDKVLYQCDFTSLPAGLYLLRIFTDNGTKTIKIVIQK